MKLSDFYYDLPPGLIAQHPAKRRSDSRMMVINRADSSIDHARFSDLPDIIDCSYFMVLNNSRVFKARLMAHRKTGGKVEIFLVRRQSGLEWVALLRPSGRIKQNEKLYFDQRNFAVVTDVSGNIERRITFASPESEQFIIRRYGKVPLPPYIKRDTIPSDRERYQTVYADSVGSVAAPTAGLHFTPSILKRLSQAGINREYVTLHVGPGTFKPVTTDKIENHKVDPEYAVMTKPVAERINRHRDDGRKLLAVGTTSVRTLEAFANSDGFLSPPLSGMVNLYIYPPYEYKIVDAMLTNFHLPKSSLLMLVSALAGYELIMEAYQKAIEERYRFYSYGDCMVIL